MTARKPDSPLVTIGNAALTIAVGGLGIGYTIGQDHMRTGIAVVLVSFVYGCWALGLILGPRE
ncbi:MAG: hypothetical protein AAF567_19000 [Actinomycetota bacterium]